MPAGGALFGNTATGPGSTGGNKHLIEVKAGKMTLKGRMVYPDKRKGMIFVYQSDDSLMHFGWQDRTTGVVEDDLIIFPDDCEYVKVPQCTTGRAYLLKFKSSTKKFFFWLQESSTAKDDENCKKINEFLNNPSSAVQSIHNHPDQDLQSLLNNMSQSQLMQLFGSGVSQMGGLSSLLGTIRGPNSGSARTNTTPAITHRTTVPSTPTTTSTSNQSATPSAGLTTPQRAISNSTPAAPKGKSNARNDNTGTPITPAPYSNPIQLSDLQSFLSGIAPPPTTEGTQAQSVDLSTALTSDALTGVLSNPDALQQLQSHLPNVNSDRQDSLRSTLASPQFQQAVSQFSSALESGQLGPIVSQLAVNPEAVAAANQGNMADFMKALEMTASTGEAEDKEKKAKKDVKKDDDEDQMQLD